jgi:hypothetical protein
MQPTTYSAPTSTSFKQSELNSTNYLSERTLRTLRDTKTNTRSCCGTNLTSVKKSMYLLIDKLTPSTRNPYG